MKRVTKAQPAAVQTVKVLRLAHAKGLPLPSYQTSGAAGVDLYAALTGPLTLAPGARALVPTGLQIALPDGWEAQVRPRSGLAAKHGVTVLNSPGTIDADYRGEISVILIHLGSELVTLNRGDRIAQLIFAPVVRAQLVETTVLPATARGGGGFGSTGVESTKARAKAAPRKMVAKAKTVPTPRKPIKAR